MATSTPKDDDPTPQDDDDTTPQDDAAVTGTPTAITTTATTATPSCTEKFGDKVEGFIGGSFSSLGLWVGVNPKRTICLSLLVTVLMGIGFMSWETENRAEKLWVPQDTIAEQETEMYQEYYSSSSRFNSMIVQADTSTSTSSSSNVLTKDILQEAMKMHYEIQTSEVTAVEGDETDGSYNFIDLCTKGGGACVNGSFEGICSCLVTSILKQWNYDLATLQADEDVLATINEYGNQDDLRAILGTPVFDEDTGLVVSAGAFTISYFLEGNAEVVDGSETDPINEAWEEEVFLEVAESVPTEFTALQVDYFAGRSFSDEFGGAITGDLFLVQISYVVALLFLGANLGKAKCGTGSRWTMALGALATVGLSTAAGFGLSSICGLFFGPVHSLLPFILLGIGVDDVFVIVNAFNRERKGPRSQEDNEMLAKRSSRALARAGASITVTSATDLVAFGISSSSRLPALASFCAYAAISIFFLWFFASTFFTATTVLDERRQRDNRRECLCCLTRKNVVEEDENDRFKEDAVSRYFRNYHAPAILSKPGKAIVFTVFAGLFGFGMWGALNLTVEDSQRSFIPQDSYLLDYLDAADEYYPDTGIDLSIVFEGSSEIYETRTPIADLETRLTGLSKASPYIAEPVSEKAYRNVMAGLSLYLNTTGTGAIGGVILGDDNWPTTEQDFITTITAYAAFGGPGAEYAQDLSMSEDGTQLEAIQVRSEYVRLTKLAGGEIIDDADRQIEAMDDTRAMIASWDDLAPVFPYSDKFIAIEGFKIIKRELFQNVGLAIAAVGVIVFLTVASPVTAILITLNVAFCIIEILGFMHALGIVIDSITVINIVLAVGLSVDYSAHVGHCFMVKGGGDKDRRALEALADIGAAVMSGAISTFLAVAVLLFSSSYVFKTLSKQFALTVGLGIAHGLIALPVMLAVLGPKPFASAEDPDKIVEDDDSLGKSIAEEEASNIEEDKKSDVDEA